SLDNLEVTGNTFLGTISGNLGVGTNAAHASIEVQKSGSNPLLMLSSNAAGLGNFVIVEPNGNVGLGTVAPGQVLDVAGTVRIRGTNPQYCGDDNKASIAASAATAPDLKFLTNSAEVMRLTHGGNVGIGSAAPGDKLDVQGTVRIGTGTFDHPSGTAGD